MTKILMAALAVVTFVAFTSQADARHRHKHKKPTLITDRLPVIADANGNPAIKYSTTFSGKRHHYRHYSRRGSCDGFHRCRCGTTQAAHFGLPLNYRGLNLKMASAWYHFPRTSLQAGAVGVRPHHVYRVVQVTGPGRAIVSDDAGTYERRVGGDTFVSVNGGTITASASRIIAATADIGNTVSLSVQCLLECEAKKKWLSLHLALL